MLFVEVITQSFVPEGLTEGRGMYDVVTGTRIQPNACISVLTSCSRRACMLLLLVVRDSYRSSITKVVVLFGKWGDEGRSGWRLQLSAYHASWKDFLFSDIYYRTFHRLCSCFDRESRSLSPLTIEEVHPPKHSHTVTYPSFVLALPAGALYRVDTNILCFRDSYSSCPFLFGSAVCVSLSLRALIFVSIFFAILAAPSEVN